jgi:hypothetical protein
MPHGSQGQRRPADVIGNVVHIARIATGEDQRTACTQPATRHTGIADVKGRQMYSAVEDRRATADKAAAVRWG